MSSFLTVPLHLWISPQNLSLETFTGVSQQNTRSTKLIVVDREKALNRLSVTVFRLTAGRYGYLIWLSK